jgi:hypothetical protein
MDVAAKRSARCASVSGCVSFQAAGFGNMNWETAFAGAAFVLSLALAGSSTYRALKGAEVDVVPPSQAIFYKSGAVLNVAVRIPMINRAADYNDLVDGARLQINDGRESFALSEIPSPIFNDDPATKQKEHCLEHLRCQTFNRMAISQRQETVVTVPAGSAEADYYGFELYCAGAGCDNYADFDHAVGTIEAQELKLVVRLNLHSDGNRVITCKVGPVDGADLRKRKWATPDCEAASVSEG